MGAKWVSANGTFALFWLTMLLPHDSQRAAESHRSGYLFSSTNYGRAEELWKCRTLNGATAIAASLASKLDNWKLVAWWFGHRINSLISEATHTGQEAKRSGNRTSLTVTQTKAMSSLLKEDLNKKLFRSLGQNLYGFIEIECSGQDRFYLCASGKWGWDIRKISYLNCCLPIIL